MDMDVYSIVNTVVTLFLGGGWFIYYKANKRKADGEATQQEAEGWAKMQEVYQKHIADMAEITDKVRDERNRALDENKELREKYNAIENSILELKKEQERQISDLKREYESQISELRNEVSRFGRKLGNALHLTCGVAGCTKRKRVTFDDVSLEEEQQESKEV